MDFGLCAKYLALIFGPVLSFITYRDEAEAIAIANDTAYGLHAYVLSSNTEHGHIVASQIVAGRALIHWPVIRRPHSVAWA